MWGSQMSEAQLDQAAKSLWSSSGLSLVFKSNTSFGCICHKFLQAFFVQGSLLSPGEYKALVFKLLEQDFNKTSSFKSQPTFLDEEFNNWTVVIANRISLSKIVEESKPVCLHYRSKVYERFISGCGCCRDWNTHSSQMGMDSHSICTKYEKEIIFILAKHFDHCVFNEVST